MNSAVIRSSAVRSGLRAKAPTRLLATTFVRGKATLPDLKCKLNFQLNCSLHNKTSKHF
jgi:hypothetical protein